ncbi:MAG TPA: phosphoribosylanthranilate isomerase [Thermoanaerobaculia bacterium]|nr:phosphoribosylanthranilate isomerase [Thermoanaerobaculia bacterium]
MNHTLVKICGVTTPADALAAVDAGADLIGLNFHPPSPRALTTERAAGIAAAVRERSREVQLVGVFVALPPAAVDAVDREVGLDLLQFHGDQTPADLAPYGDRAIQVIRIPPQAPPSPAEIERRFAACPDAWGFLFDVAHPTLAGGTGETFGWSLLAGVDRGSTGPLAGRPILVAGGITPGNAGRALADSRADGVDVASGVESAPGEKDLQLIERLIQEVRDGAFARPAG